MLAYTKQAVNAVGVSTDGGPEADASLRSLSGTTPHGSEIRFVLDAGGGDSLPTVGEMVYPQSNPSKIDPRSDDARQWMPAT